MYSRFRFTNGLKALRKEYSNSDLVKRILRSLPCAYRPKVMTIQESKNLNVYTLQELMGSLMTYEIKLSILDEREKKTTKKTLALSTPL